MAAELQEQEREQETEGRLIVRALRRRILRQELLPGSHLREQPLAQEFGVSRQLVREALVELEVRGLVEREPNRGAVVRRYGLGDLLQMMEVREVLEGLCARIATQNVPPQSWQDLLDLFGAPTEALIAAGDLEGYLANHELLRRRMRDAAASPTLATSLEAYNDRTALVMRRLVLATDRSQQALAEHRAVLAAMRSGEADEAERLKRAQIRSARQALKLYHRFVL